MVHLRINVKWLMKKSLWSNQAIGGSPCVWGDGVSVLHHADHAGLEWSGTMFVANSGYIRNIFLSSVTGTTLTGNIIWDETMTVEQW